MNEENSLKDKKQVFTSCAVGEEKLICMHNNINAKPLANRRVFSSYCSPVLVFFVATFTGRDDCKKGRRRTYSI